MCYQRMRKAGLITPNPDICPKCKVAPTSGKSGYCKACAYVHKREWAARNPSRQSEASRKGNLKSKYGLTEADWEAMWQACAGTCEICLEPLLPGNRTLQSASVDHDHETGKVRGLICGGCNRGLGHFRDDADSLSRAADYIRTHAE